MHRDVQVDVIFAVLIKHLFMYHCRTSFEDFSTHVGLLGFRLALSLRVDLASNVNAGSTLLPAEEPSDIGSSTAVVDAHDLRHARSAFFLCM